MGTGTLAECTGITLNCYKSLKIERVDLRTDEDAEVYGILVKGKWMAVKTREQLYYPM